MARDLNIIEEADGRLSLEIEGDDMLISIDLEEDEAADLHRTLSDILQDRWVQEYGMD